MCCWYSKKKTEALRRKIKKGQNIFWKTYKIQWRSPGIFIVSPIQGVVLRLEKNGNVQSNRKSIELEREENDSKEIYEGIHVYTKKREAESYVRSHNLYDFFIPVTYAPEDLIARDEYAGAFHAVFTKIHINKKDLVIAINKKLDAWGYEDVQKLAEELVEDHCKLVKKEIKCVADIQNKQLRICAKG